MLTTQYLEEADQLADRIAFMNQGAIVAEGTPNQLKASIGGKTLTIRLSEQQDYTAVWRLLSGHHNLSGALGDDPHIIHVPVPMQPWLVSPSIHWLDIRCR
ncbi:hypothetical protein [Paenibacillus pinihumi]|uniref:hypothetical protein n=1 Tax=Paenibacillus pinihumi TaxID=669462 RepID=UPI00040C5548|nr:hypothetical protein [Paenibacillus pinihumi]